MPGAGPNVPVPAHLESHAEVPECPPGWRTGPPDFIGVGAQRAGTKWWYELIVDHPRVERVAAVRRELHFFERFWDGSFSAADAASYHRFFARPDGAIAGEWTPRYMLDFWTPRLLKRAAPEAKLLVLLRDPIDRYRSGLARELRLAERRGAALSPMIWSDTLSRGRYSEQLARLLRFFDRERILVLQYERCRSAPADELRRTYSFLGVEPTGHLPAEMTEQVGRALSKRELAPDLEADLVAALADDVRELAERFPEIDVGLWPSFSGAV